jgi:hypothetical protein
LSKQTDPTPDLFIVQDEKPDHQERASKKQFVEPQVLAPLDVLESTTSFLFVTADTSVIS